MRLLLFPPSGGTEVLFDEIAPLFHVITSPVLRPASLDSLYNSLRYKELQQGGGDKITAEEKTGEVKAVFARADIAAPPFYQKIVSPFKT
jgi:hypothetical protein